MAADEHELLLTIRAAAGDREAFDRLLRGIQHLLFSYIASLVGRPDHAEEILQEVFVRIYRKLRWLREPLLFRPWAYRIATRECFRQLKRQRRWSTGFSEENLVERASADPEDHELASELAERLPELLEGLSPASRTVVVLHYLHELTLEEVAAVLDIPPGTAKSRLAYGLASLRRQWKERTHE